MSSVFAKYSLSGVVDSPIWEPLLWRDLIGLMNKTASPL